jgi:hypothetical protein
MLQWMGGARRKLKAVSTLEICWAARSPRSAAVVHAQDPLKCLIRFQWCVNLRFCTRTNSGTFVWRRVCWESSPKKNDPNLKRYTFSNLSFFRLPSFSRTGMHWYARMSWCTGNANFLTIAKRSEEEMSLEKNLERHAHSLITFVRIYTGANHLTSLAYGVWIQLRPTSTPQQTLTPILLLVYFFRSLYQSFCAMYRICLPCVLKRCVTCFFVLSGGTDWTHAIC